jgi:hypothetical protein
MNGASSERQHSARRLAPILWVLLAAFAMRVTGQVLVVLIAPPWLPPMPEWMSGLLPYRYLLPSQVVILGLLAKVCWDFSRGRGHFVTGRAWLGTPTWVLGWVYASAMVIRYALTMWLAPHMRWVGGTIPIIFHLVLATFVILVGAWHRSHPPSAEY